MNTTARPSAASAAAAAVRASRPSAVRFTGSACGSSGSSSTIQPNRDRAAGSAYRCVGAAESVEPRRRIALGQQHGAPGRGAAAADRQHALHAIADAAASTGPARRHGVRRGEAAGLETAIGDPPASAPVFQVEDGGALGQPGQTAAGRARPGTSCAPRRWGAPPRAPGGRRRPAPPAGAARPSTAASQPNWVAAAVSVGLRGSNAGASNSTRSPQRISTSRRQPGAGASSARGACESAAVARRESAAPRSGAPRARRGPRRDTSSDAAASTARRCRVTWPRGWQAMTRGGVWLPCGHSRLLRCSREGGRRRAAVFKPAGFRRGCERPRLGASVRCPRGLP